MPTRLIVAIIMLAAALLLGFFLVWPKFQDFQQMRTELEQKKAELDSKTSYYSQIKSIWNRLDEYRDSLSLVESAVSKNYSLPALFNYLQELSGQTGLVLGDLTLSGVKGENIREISFNLGVSGSYASLKSFLSALENSARLFNVKSINFSSPEKEDDEISFNITIAAYSY